MHLGAGAGVASTGAGVEPPVCFVFLVVFLVVLAFAFLGIFFKGLLISNAVRHCEVSCRVGDGFLLN